MEWFDNLGLMWGIMQKEWAKSSFAPNFNERDCNQYMRYV